MKEWKEYRLGKCCRKIGSGATPRGGGDTYMPDGEYTLVRSQNVLDFTFSYEGLAYINKEQAEKLNNVALEEGDVLLNITGDSVARVCQLPEELIPGRVNQHVAIIRPDSQVLNPKFLKYYLLNPVFKEHLLMLSSFGATRNALTKGMIENLIILAPPLHKQVIIAEILSSLDDKIELNNKINSNLQNMAQALFKQWFIEFEFPTHGGDSYQALGGKMENSELGEIPEGWKVIKFKETVEKFIDNRGKTPPIESEGIPLVEVRNMSNDNIYPTFNTKNYVSEDTFSSWFRAHLETDDILMSTVGTIGRLNISPKNKKYAIAQNILGIRFKKQILTQRFMFCLMRSKFFNDEINSRLITTVQASIKRKDIENISIVLPPINLIKKFDETVSPSFKMINNSTEEIESLITLRDILIPRLISSELEVNEIQINQK